ncbi:MAG: Uma2 family endonuclease [Lachnospiraceae bacterium]|uniref:Uma2 family endonuclease n=1 Tax=uncultured Acetatifactor sp. TaxID=1671927 RepID=UPI00262A7ECD|nr:Uma2 family endonuclease [uncultured Acetatifactor sp.]MCI8790252.1 Uma2 family endonuclease [Lachnospiraceae bacterium]
MTLPQEHVYTMEDLFALPDGQRAELIDGQIVNMAPPSPFHQELVMELSAAIRQHIKKNGGNCKVYPAPLAVNLHADDKTWVEPDISIICDQNKITDKACEGAPDWIIEVTSPSTQSHDYLKKLWLYRSSGVREYWIVNPVMKNVQVYFFDGEESSCQYSFRDTIPCHIFNDLTICVSNLL